MNKSEFFRSPIYFEEKPEWVEKLNNLSDQDMLDNFVAGRETQYKSLKRALAAELGLDATFDALLRDDRDHNKLKGFTGKMSESL